VRRQAGDVGAGQRQDGVLLGVLGQARVAFAWPPALGHGLVHGEGDVVLVEHDHVAVGEAEGIHLGAAHVAMHGVVADALDVAGRADGAAARAQLGDEGVAQVAAIDEGHHARRGGQRGDLHALDVDRHRVAHLGAFDGHRLRHFVPALELGRDHRAPASGGVPTRIVPPSATGPSIGCPDRRCRGCRWKRPPLCSSTCLAHGNDSLHAWLGLGLPVARVGGLPRRTGFYGRPINSIYTVISLFGRGAAISGKLS
jgi:hypothetical protein